MMNLDPSEQQRDADDEAEERELLGHVARVERSRQRRLRDPRVAGRVGDWLAALVFAAAASSLVPFGSSGFAADT